MSGGGLRTVIVGLVLLMAAAAPGSLPATAAQAAENHQITGRVYAPTDGEDFWVTLYRVEGDASTSRVESWAASAGALFSFDVPDGTYKLYTASDRYDGYPDSEPEWYPDAPTAAVAEEILVDGADVVVESIVLEARKTISGRVVGSSGTGVRGLGVRSYPVDDPDDVARFARTDGEGRFVLPSGRGRWKVLIEDPNLMVAPVWLGGAANHGDAAVYEVQDDVTVPPTTVTDGASISGLVTSSLGGPVRGLNISVYDGDGEVIQEETTRRDGYYRVPTLAPGSYRLLFGWEGWPDTSFVGEFYDDQASLASATPITVTEGQSVTGIDVLLTGRTWSTPASPGISGRVVDAQGTPLSGKVVRVTDRDDETSHGQSWFDAETTDANGVFHFSNLPSDRSVRFFVDDYTPTGVADDVHGVGIVYYPGVRDYQDAQPFDAPDTRVFLPDLVVEETGAIRGTVLTEEGLAFDDWPVQDPAHRPRITVLDDAGHEAATALVDSNGAFRIRDLPAGQYRVDFVDDAHERDSYVDAWWGGASMTEARPISVIPGRTTSGIDSVVQTRERIVEGRLQDAAGRSLSGIVVHAVRGPEEGDLEQRIQGRSAADGTFRLHLVPGSYKLHFGDQYNYRDAVVDEYYDDRADFDTATPVLVPSGQPPTSLGNITLALEPAMSGRVVDELGRPLVGAGVVILGADGEEVSEASSDVNGRWKTPGLLAGTYRVRFSYGYATEYYDDQPTLATSTPVVLAPGTWRPGIDAQMGPGENPPPDPGDPPPGPDESLRNLTVPRIVGTPVVGQTVVADPGSWSGGDTPSYTYRWTHSGRTVGTGPVYPVMAADGGQDLALVVTATSGEQSASAPSAPVRVMRAASTTRIIGRPPVAAGNDMKRLRIIVTVTGPGETLGGLVKLRIDGRVLATLALNQDHVRRSVLLAPGRHTLEARFLGSTAWSPSRDRSTIRIR